MPTVPDKNGTIVPKSKDELNMGNRVEPIQERVSKIRQCKSTGTGENVTMRQARFRGFVVPDNFDLYTDDEEEEEDDFSCFSGF
ncbi:hypothetical protein K501DRAFT_289055 [Backusella circina FSU 941]|nr:hypothetical protein K501DRAFT_289055 [Backusella circina FSU 941]